MSELEEVYGSNYQTQSRQYDTDKVVKDIANNLAHRNYVLMKDSAPLWKDNNLPKKTIQALIKTVSKINPHMRLTHVSKTSSMINIFPAIINGPCEYFVLTDLSKNRVVLESVYITPGAVNAF